MTYTKKKIAIEVEVPDGATHLVMSDYGIEWWRLEKWWSIWFERTNRWESIEENYKPNGKIVAIEVIE